MNGVYTLKIFLLSVHFISFLAATLSISFGQMSSSEPYFLDVTHQSCLVVHVANDSHKVTKSNSYASREKTEYNPFSKASLCCEVELISPLIYDLYSIHFCHLN